MQQGRGTTIVASLSILILSGHAVGAQPAEIFSDGFESGDLSGWSGVVPAPPASSACVAGPPVSGVLGGDLGPAPAGTFDELTCVEIRNDRGFERDEVAYSGVPMPRIAGFTTTDGLVLVGPGGRRLAAQLDVLSRWGGPVDDPNLPIRWLEVSVTPRAPANGTAVYALRRYGSSVPAADPLAAAIVPQGAAFVVDTGLATFVLDPANPALFETMAVDLDDDGVGRTVVYRHSPGAGPRLVFDPDGAGPGGAVTLETSSAGQVTVDPGGFRIVERGPVKVVVNLDGHFVDPGGGSLCSPWSAAPYESLGFTLVATFVRGRRDVLLKVVFRNECSDAFGGDWTDETVTVDRLSWELPFTGFGVPTPYYGGGGAVAAGASGFAGETRVEQRKGAGDPWQRRARVVVGGAGRETAAFFAAPFVAVAGDDIVAGATMPWMRFREPQALAIVDSTVSLRFISEALVVGEGKGLWNVAELSLQPRAGLGPMAAALETRRRRMTAELEDGLLVRAPRDHVNDSRLFAGLGTGASSPIKTAYLDLLDTLHSQTVEAGGQWDRAKTFGSQLWPDVPFDPWGVDFPSSPAENDGAMNYWNPSGAELMEFLRSGDPRWVWDFALPQSWLQMVTAYLNLGDHAHGNRAGFAVTSGGSGEGQWHRSAYGSDDYSYNLGQQLAYVLRPCPVMRDRFSRAGRTVVDRYSIPRANQGDRELFVDQVDITRQVIQHFEMLANCAEFVPGDQGRACHDRLLETVAELAQDNLRAGLMCQGDIPAAGTCGQPQRFMQNSLMFHFFHRYFLNYGDVNGRLGRALVEDPLNFYRQGIPKLGDGVSLDVSADWAALLDCTLTAGDDQVAACSWVQTGDGDMLWHNKPHTVALMLMAHELDPSIGLCAMSKAALDDPAITIGWSDNLSNDPGWWKGASQMVQGMVFGVGLYDTCVDP